MKIPNKHVTWTEVKNLALSNFLSRTIDEEHFTKTRDITVEIPENIKFFFAKTPFANNLDANTAYVTIQTTKSQKKHATQY